MCKTCVCEPQDKIPLSEVEGWGLEGSWASSKHVFVKAMNGIWKIDENAF